MIVEFSKHAGSFFNKPSLDEREEAEESVVASIARVKEQLDGRLKLPPKVKVSFFNAKRKGADVRSQPPRMRISLAQGYAENPDMLDKTVAHEFSHLSDIAENNNCINHYLVSRAGLFLQYKAISEGKAQHVSSEVAGREGRLGIPDHLIDEVYGETGILTRARTLAYPVIGARQLISEAYRMSMGEGLYSVTAEYGSPYKLGYELVQDALVGAEASSVLDIHNMPVQFFLRAARVGHAERMEQMGRQYETAA